MAKLPILEFPDPKLRTVAKPIEKVDDQLRTLIHDMFETMYEAPGIGLAATQIDFHRRLIVMDVSEEKNNPLVFINPEFKPLSDETIIWEEGCLSVPGFYDSIERYQHVLATGLNAEGHSYKIELQDLAAVCLQHEIDHLDGKLFVDYLSPIKRQRVKKKMQKQHKMRA